MSLVARHAYGDAPFTRLQLPEKLAPLFQPRRYKVMHGGRGGGKSWSVAGALLALGADRPLRILCAREIQKSMRDSVHRLLRDQIVKLGMECEIVVRLGRDLPPQATPYTRESVAEAVDEIMPGIELVDERYQDFHALGVPTLVADDFFNAGCVLGPARPDWRSLDLGALLGRTWINGVEVASGRGAAVLGHPFNALAWLANAQHEYGLPGLKAGEFVMLGSLVQTQWLNAGDKVRIAIESLGEVRLDVGD